jgi:hypothetical protein
MPVTDSNGVRVLSQRLKRSGGCRKITSCMSVACVNETLDLVEASDEAWLLHRCAQRETAWMLESAIWRSWFLKRVPQLKPQDNRLRWKKYLRRAYRWAKERWPRTVQQFDFRVTLGSTWLITASPKLERAPDIGLEKLGHEIGYASMLWDARDRLVEDPARTLALNRASSGANEYLDRQSRAKLGATTVRVSAQKGMGVIGARRVGLMIKKSRAGVLIVPNADRLGRAACEAATDAFALCGVGVRLLAPGGGAAHCPNVDRDDGALLDGLIIAPKPLAGDCGARVCDSVLMRRPPWWRWLGVAAPSRSSPSSWPRRSPTTWCCCGPAPTIARRSFSAARKGFRPIWPGSRGQAAAPPRWVSPGAPRRAPPRLPLMLAPPSSSAGCAIRRRCVRAVGHAKKSARRIFPGVSAAAAWPGAYRISLCDRPVAGRHGDLCRVCRPRHDGFPRSDRGRIGKRGLPRSERYPLRRLHRQPPLPA